MASLSGFQIDRTSGKEGLKSKADGNYLENRASNYLGNKKIGIVNELKRILEF